MKCINCRSDIRDDSARCDLCGSTQPKRPAPSAPAGKPSEEGDVDWWLAIQIIGGIAAVIILALLGYAYLM
ncbi:hypothetical protein [Rhodoferax sp. OV413]|uniref:hypothetical protein n=1 Tax=Rhodoferax sp. OV413 TaxID=1855285 RepID=UPI0025FAD965|nr:hypothetical protein [Rhodoferax sp. OV413]